MGYFWMIANLVCAVVNAYVFLTTGSALNGAVCLFNFGVFFMLLKDLNDWSS